MKNKLKFLFDNRNDFVLFLKTRIPMLHNSNLFFRDIQYGIRDFFDKKGKKISYADSELLANELISTMESENQLRKVNNIGWLFTNPDFKTPKKEKQV